MRPTIHWVNYTGSTAVPMRQPTHHQLSGKGTTHRVREKGNFYGTKRWLNLRKMKLNETPLCEDPFGFHKEDGIELPATEVHHIIPRRARPDLAMVMSNLQCLCKFCHGKQIRKLVGRTYYGSDRGDRRQRPTGLSSPEAAPMDKYLITGST